MTDVMGRRAIGIVSALCVAWGLWTSAASARDHSEQIRIGVLAFRGAEHVMRSWSATAQYLSAVIPDRRFEIVPLPLAELREATAAGRIDYVLTNSGQYVELEEKFGISRIATLKKSFSDGVRNVFGAVILVRADRDDLRELTDLKGKVFGAVSRHAFGGFQMAWRELKAKGLDPFDTFSEIKFFGFPQDSIVLAVRDGGVDAGTVRTDVLEAMARQGAVNINDFRVLNQLEVPGVNVVLSTRLYPEWPFSKMPHVSTELSEKIAIALLTLSAESPAMQAARASGWTVPLDYKPVHDLFRELEIGPYAPGEVRIVDVITAHWEWVVFASVLFVLMILHGVRTEYLVQRRTRQLSMVNRELEREVVERRSAEERASQHEAELAHVSRINVIGEMTSGLAHELRQPLAAIRNYAEGGMQRLRRRGNDAADIDGALSHILEQAGRAGEIVSRVRGYMRKRDPRRELVDLNHAVVEAERFFRHDAKSNNVSIAFELADDLPQVSADLIELEQLIINVCRNAIEAMQDGKAPRTLKIETSFDDGAVRVVVADTGPGLSTRQLDEVWQPFFTTKERGLGLGLAICRSIVEAHGGKISAENRVEGGLLIVFRIPVAEGTVIHEP